MAGYDDTYRLIIRALMGRTPGTEIQPTLHQEMALSMLNYVRSLELVANAPFIGIANEGTQPVQPDDSRACYISAVPPETDRTYINFHRDNGDAIRIVTGEMQSVLVIFVWDGSSWSYTMVDTSIEAHSNSANYFYNLTIRKTYASVAAMNADVSAPVGNDGRKIKVGEIVSVHNESTPAEDAIYSWEKGPKWQLQTRLSNLDSRLIDCGHAQG